MSSVHRIGPNLPGRENVLSVLAEAVDLVMNNDGIIDPDRVLVLLLDKSPPDAAGEGSFCVKFLNGGMKMSEAVAVTEAAKMMFLQEMRYVGKPAKESD